MGLKGKSRLAAYPYIIGPLAAKKITIKNPSAVL
jgi:hypothetical protein